MDMESDTKENVRTAIRRKVVLDTVLDTIGRGTIQKQFFDYHAGEYPSDTADDAIEAYVAVVYEMTRLYNRGYGCVKLVEILKEYCVDVTEKTVLHWLRERGVPIRAPLRDRPRQPHGAWEISMATESDRLTDELEDAEQRYSSLVDDLTMCESALRICSNEKRWITKRLEECRREVKEIVIQGVTTATPSSIEALNRYGSIFVFNFLKKLKNKNVSGFFQT